MKVTNGVSKFIDELLMRYPEMLKVATGEKTLARDEGTALYRSTKTEETIRIVSVTREVLEALEENKRIFIQEYYWGSTNKTIEAAGREVFVDVRTAKRWKKEIAGTIAKRLGWL